MNATRTREDTFLTLAVALSIWGAAVVAAAGYGVFAKLSPAAFGALAAFATAFAVGTYFLDERLRGFVKNAGGVAMITVVLDATILAAIASLAASGPTWREIAAQLPMPGDSLRPAACREPARRALRRPRAAASHVTGEEVTWRDPGRDLSIAYQRSTFGRGTRSRGR
jgi:hypothetical protein